MSHTRLWVAATIIALVVVVVFVLSVPRTSDVPETSVSDATPVSVPLVTLRDVFKKGMHTITGSLSVPNACTTVSAQATSSIESILVEIFIPSVAGVCLQVPTLVSFRTTLAAPADLPFTVTVNGSLASTSMP